MDVNFWKGKRVLITGAYGFLGTHLLKQFSQEEELKVVDATELSAKLGVKPGTNAAQGIAASPGIYIPGIYVFKSSDYNLRNLNRVYHLFSFLNPQIVIHLAAKVGGIEMNIKHPATMCFANALMALHCVCVSSKKGVEKFVNIGTVCSYPAKTPVPYKEEDIWEGYPESTNAAYGESKRFILTLGQAYAKQYGLRCIYLVLSNLYGEYDKFDGENPHVIPALIKRFLNAKRSNTPEVNVWGSGEASREFMHAEDAAKAIIRAVEVYDSPEPLNIGSGQDVQIAGLTELIVKLIGYEGKVSYDLNKPEGHLHRVMSLKKMKEHLDITASVGLEEGLKRTIDWYKWYTNYVEVQPAQERILVSVPKDIA